MGIIKEPKGVDLVIGPSVLKAQDKKMISEVIAYYKRTGKKPSRKKSVTSPNTRKKKVTAKSS